MCPAFLSWRVPSRLTPPHPKSQRYFSVFPSRSVIVSVHTFKWSAKHLDWVRLCIGYESWGLFLFIWSFLFSGIIYRKDYPTLIELSQHHGCVGVFLDALFCSTVLYVDSYTKPHRPDYCRFTRSLKSGSVSSTTRCFSRIVLAILDPLYFHKNFIMTLSNSKINKRQFIEILIEIPLNFRSLWGELTSYQRWVLGFINSLPSDSLRFSVERYFNVYCFFSFAFSNLAGALDLSPVHPAKACGQELMRRYRPPVVHRAPNDSKLSHYPLQIC